MDLEVILFLYLLTSERWAFRALKMRPVGRCCFWHGTPLKMRPVRQEAVHSQWSWLFCAPLKTHRVPHRSPFLSPNVSENASRTRGGCFAHRISLPYRKRLFFTPNASENASRTPGSLFEHRMRIPYRRSLFLVRRASENASHLVVRSTEKRVAVASERPVHPRTG